MPGSIHGLVYTNMIYEHSLRKFCVIDWPTDPAPDSTYGEVEHQVERLVIWPFLPTRSLVDASEIALIVHKYIYPFRRPYQCIIVKVIIDTINQYSTLALLPSLPVIRFVMGRSMNMARLNVS